jgi:hypothetical protein
MQKIVVADVFHTSFPGEAWTKRWTQSSTKKSSGEAGKFKLTAGSFYGDAKEDVGIQTAEDARFYFYTAPIAKEFSNEGKTLVVQFSVKHEQVGVVFGSPVLVQLRSARRAHCMSVCLVLPAEH